MTRFSIIIPCYNAAGTLSETLRSIANQTYDAWDVICIDDGSTDATCDILRNACARDPRICFIKNDGKGPSRARNLGALSVAQGDIVAFCDADDIWGPDKLAQLADCFADQEVDAAYGQIAFFQNDPAKAQVFSTVPRGPLTIPMLLGENPVCTMSNIAVRRAALVQTQGFDETMVHNEDLDWLIRLVGGGARVMGIDICQTWYRSSNNGLSADLPAMMQGRKAALLTAARFGQTPSRKSNAIFFRYLARRALRLGQNRGLAFGFALRGLISSPAGFFDTPRRGLFTLIGAVVAPALPMRLSRALFSR
jgi:glycosyltransferase involved in cell wall biosynthesis